MIRLLPLTLLAALLIALASPPGVAQDVKDAKKAQPDDDPPVLLKKKKTDDKPLPDAKPKDEKPQVKDEKKPADKEELKPKDEPDPVADLEAKAKEIMARIAKNMKSSEDRLKAQDSGDGTQQVQRDVVKDLDELLEQIKKQEEQQQAGGGGGGGGQSQPGMGGGKGKRTTRSKGQGQGQKQGQSPGGEQSAKGGQKNGDGQGQGQGQGQGNQAGGGGTSPQGVDKLADLYKDVWGHLPETLRQEMDAYQKEGYMTKYKELLKLYYATIAEKGRRAQENDK